MKKSQSLFYLSMVLLILLAACAPASTPTATQAPATAAPPTDTATAAVPTDTATAAASTAAPINLAGPPMQVGSTYLYFDGSLLVAVPAGPFTMGHGGQDDPVHTVTLSDFWIYSTKVTNTMYALCLSAGKCTPPDPTDNPLFTDPTHGNDPVVGVNYDQASAYCTFAQGRLPTEAEWEKTARGPNANIYPWGNNAPACDLLNYGTCVGKKTPVTTYPKGKSYYDALDMSGNAFEWVADWYLANYYATSPANDPKGPDNGTKRSVRSTAYNSDGYMTASANRYSATPDTHRSDLGFRCVVLDPTFYAPYCQLALVYGPNANGNPPGNGSSSSQCPPLTHTEGDYCNPSTGTEWGHITVGANAPSQLALPVGINPAQAPLCSPPNPGGTSFDCPGGTTINLQGTCSVQPVGGPSCPPGYSQQGNSCVSQGGPGQCPAGYQKNPSQNCCTAIPGANASVPPCMVGTHYFNGACVDDSQNLSGPAPFTWTTDTGLTGCGGNNHPGGGNPTCPPNTKWNGQCCANSDNRCTGTSPCLSAGTQIDTPNGPIAVQDLQVGDLVWSASTSGVRFVATVLKVQRTPVPADHLMVRVLLADGRELYASVGHPTADGRTLGDLRPGDLLDGSTVVSVTRGPYNQPATYDLLPSGGTGFYWANGILIGSTLANP